ncbi:hypothetical protein B7Z00_04075 [Candidatus Saccharibacteria bacterium 32-50-10]|nr:MAG: hypothetical protein B7Z00_04075 [Candidatus Saccharibacteria bacterium 32-50-10]
MQLPSYHNKPTKQHGFTLVEMLVIVPVALLAIAALISLMVALVGDVMMARSRAASVYELQETLDRIEQDSRISSAFLPTYSQLTSPQGRNGGTASFSASGPNYDLILNMPATTANPYSGSRNLVYYADQPNPCSGTYQGNRPLTVRVVYFTTDNGNGTKTLWRRTIVPTWTTTAGSASSVCAAPWQRDSCPLGSTISATCQTFDEKMLTSVTVFIPTYYDANGATTTDVRNAVSMSIRLNQSQQVAGESITSSSTARISHVNGTTEQVPSAAPTITIDNPDINTMNNPVLTSLTWNSVPHAAYYSLRYRIDGGAWVYPADQTDTTFQITTARPLDIINFEVTPKNDMGAGSIGTLTYTKPLWTVANLINGWECYSPSSWPCPSYTLSSAGVVLLRGLAANGATETSMFTLPASLTPNKQIIFPVVNGGTSVGRFDVRPNGEVIWKTAGGNSGFVSLDNIRVLAQGIANPSWLAATAVPAWASYGGEYGTAQYVKDSAGRTHVYGLLRYGNPMTTNPILTMPTTYHPSLSAIWPTVTYPNATASFQVNSTNIITRTQGSSSWYAIAAMYYPSSTAATFSAMTLMNSWVNYGGTYVTASYTKASDGIVSLRGLIRSGVNTSGTIIATLPAGYCPGWRILSGVAAGGVPGDNASQTIGRVDVIWNGTNCDVKYTSTSPSAGNSWYFSLDGISYMQER